MKKNEEKWSDISDVPDRIVEQYLSGNSYQRPSIKIQHIIFEVSMLCTHYSLKHTNDFPTRAMGPSEEHVNATRLRMTRSISVSPPGTHVDATVVSAVRKKIVNTLNSTREICSGGVFHHWPEKGRYVMLLLVRDIHLCNIVQLIWRQHRWTQGLLIRFHLCLCLQADLCCTTLGPVSGFCDFVFKSRWVSFFFALCVLLTDSATLSPKHPSAPMPSEHFPGCWVPALYLYTLKLLSSTIFSIFFHYDPVVLRQDSERCVGGGWVGEFGTCS